MSEQPFRYKLIDERMKLYNLVFRRKKRAKKLNKETKFKILLRTSWLDSLLNAINEDGNQLDDGESAIAFMEFSQYRTV